MQSEIPLASAETTSLLNDKNYQPDLENQVKVNDVPKTTIIERALAAWILVILFTTLLISADLGAFKVVDHTRLKFYSSTMNRLTISSFYNATLFVIDSKARGSAETSPASGISRGEGWTAFPTEESEWVLNKGGWTAFPTAEVKVELNFPTLELSSSSVYPSAAPTLLVEPSPSPTGWMWYY